MFDSQRGFDPGSYQHYLKAKLAELQDLVKSNLVRSAGYQKTHYDKRSATPSFAVHDKV